MTSPSESVKDAIDKMMKDAFLADYVDVRLAELGDVSCEVCSTQRAALVCLDCQKYFCTECAVAHGTSNDHTLQALQRSSRDVTLSNTKKASSIEDLSKQAGVIRDSDNCEEQSEVLQEAKRTYTQVQQLKEVGDDLEDFITQLKKVQESLKKQHEVLLKYADRLACLDDAETNATNGIIVRVRQAQHDFRPPTIHAMAALKRCVFNLYQVSIVSVLR